MLEFNALTLTIFLVCLALSAFFSATESAMLSFQRLRLRHQVAQGVAGARRVERMLEQPNKLLATILLGNNLVNTAAATIGAAVAVSLLGSGKGVLVATFAVTAILLVLGEVVPKTLAVHHAERVSMMNAPMLALFGRLFLPFITLLRWVSLVFTRALGTPAPPRYLIGEEELRTLISESSKAGVVDVTEAAMMHRVLEFGDRRMDEVMVPRSEIVFLEAGTTLSQFLAIHAKRSHSRFPVYRDDVDNVIGVLYTKDVLKALAGGATKPDSVVTGLVRPAYFVPKSKRIGDLFTELRSRRTQLAMVVDEFGGVSGLVTLKQLTEQIVGPVGDEHVEAEQPVIRIDERTVQVAGDIRIDEFNRHLRVHLPEGRYETLAGFLIERLARVPREGDSVWHDGLRLVVTKMKGARVDKVLVTKPTGEGQRQQAHS